MEKITKDDIENWIGSDNTLEETLDILTKIANRSYSIKLFREEVIGYMKMKTKKELIDWIQTNCEGMLIPDAAYEVYKLGKEDGKIC